MILDNNLIAYEFFPNQFTPKPVYQSGERDESKLINKYSALPNETVLMLEDDIANEEGYGLKKGFYNIKPDKYYDFLLIYQTGKLKAKIPVVKMEVYETTKPKQLEVKKMSKARYLRELEKEQRKYLKGENPDEVEWSEAKIQHIDELNAWVVEYNTNSVQLIGIIKF